MGRLYSNGIALPNVRYTSKHLGRLIHTLSKATKKRSQSQPETIFSWAEVFIPMRYRSHIKPLIWAAGRNPHCNKYHHDWHNKTVMMMAAILSENLKCKPEQRFNLMFSAMVHDLDHRGRYMSHQDFVEERRSALIAGRRLYGRRGGEGRSWRLLKDRLDHTAFLKGHLIHYDPNDITAILMDADIMASLVFPLKSVQELTRHLKQELRSKQSADVMLKNFIHVVAQRGLASTSAFKALQRLNLSQTALGHYPDAMKTILKQR